MRIIKKHLIVLTIILFMYGFIFSAEIGATTFSFDLKEIITNNNINEYKLINSPTHDFDNNITEYMNQAHMPSLSAAIIKNDSVVWQKGYGFSDIYSKIEATENTIYLGASISKTITATAIMQLWELGLFDLDDDVNNYLPFSLRNPEYPDVNITFRMLLSHHSSLNSGEISLFIYFSFFGLSEDWYPEYLIPSGKLYGQKY